MTIARNHKANIGRIFNYCLKPLVTSCYCI